MIHDLLVRLGWDGSTYRRGLAQAELDAQRSAARTERTLNKFVADQQKFLFKRVSGYLGAGFAFREVRKQAEEMARIADSAARLGLSAEQFQALEFAAAKTGIPVSDLARDVASLPESAARAVREFEQLGRVIPNDTVKQVTDAYRQIGAAGGWLQKLFLVGPAGMLGLNPGPAGALAGGLGGIAQAFNSVVGGARWALGKVGINLPAADSGPYRNSEKESESGRVVGPFSTMLDYELLKEKTSREEAANAAIKKAFEARGALNPQGLDPLAKIGGFTGGAGREEQLTIQRQQLDMLERIKEILERNRTTPGNIL